MKLLRFEDKEDKKESYGILDEKNLNVINLPLLSDFTDLYFPESLEDLIRERIREENLEKIILNSPQTVIAKVTKPLKKLRIKAPLINPPKIICLGLNYKDHAAEQGKEAPREPIIFMKPRTAIIGPNDSIKKPSFVKQLDYEAELAVVIGKKCKNVSPEQAQSCIFGCTILNDISARDIQFQDKQWTRGKSFDTFAPIGPNITTMKQVENSSNLKIQTWVNKELRQNSTTKNMALNVFEIVHQLSRTMTLEPCDIIATGTPAGVGFAMKPKPCFLDKGDVIQVKIENIGTLKNEVVEE